MAVNKKAGFVFLALTLLATIFIFSNSLKVGTESAKQSGFFADILENALDSFGFHPEYDTISFIIRKGAHFTEYLILSALAGLSIYFFARNGLYVFFAPLYAFGVAVCDEFIVQGMTEGRSPQWKDVFIDFSGALTAALIIYLIFRFKKQK